ncbi:MAG: hypothetical protein NT050_11300 [Verrucomicrobia bacterium]|nr:hypothetical protein [Verrucomicrobiota bacterium]
MTLRNPSGVSFFSAVSVGGDVDRRLSLHWGFVEREHTKTALAAVNGGEITIISLLV